VGGGGEGRGVVEEAESCEKTNSALQRRTKGDKFRFSKADRDEIVKRTADIRSQERNGSQITLELCGVAHRLSMIAWRKNKG